MIDECEQMEIWLNGIQGFWPAEQVSMLREGWRLMKERAALPVEAREDDPELSLPEIFFLLIQLRGGVEQITPAGFFNLTTLPPDDALKSKAAAVDSLKAPCRSSLVFRAFYDFVVCIYRIRYGIEFELDPSGDPWPRALLIRSRYFGTYWAALEANFKAPDETPVFTIPAMAALKEKLDQEADGNLSVH